MGEINGDSNVQGSDSEEILKTLRESAESEEVWQGQDSDASYGIFMDLEKWIHEYPGLNFLRYSGSSYESGPCEEWSVDGTEGSAQYTSDGEPYMTHGAIRLFMGTLESFKEEDAPNLMNSKNWAEEFIAKFYLEKGRVPTILEYIKAEDTAPTYGILEIV